MSATRYERLAVIATLEAAADLLERGWCQGAVALDADGVSTSCHSKTATRWCLIAALTRGAADRLGLGPEHNIAVDAASACLRSDLNVRWLSGWNDAFEQNQLSVVRAVRATLARVRAAAIADGILDSNTASPPAAQRAHPPATNARSARPQ